MKNNIHKLSILLFVYLFTSVSLSFAEDVLDYRLKAQQVAEDTYVFIGAKEDFSYENGGNIVNTGFIVTDKGVVVIDTGPSLLYGKQMRAAIGNVTDKPIIKVLNTHHHPDHFLGNQAFKDIPIYALPQSIESLKRDAEGFLDNVYRMSGNWISGTDFSAENIKPHTLTQEEIGGHSFKYLVLAGHTAADLVILDETTGVLFAGDLVFHNRTLTTPHAEPEKWLESLSVINGIDYKVIVPGHGEVAIDKAPIEQTRDYLVWIESTIRDSVNKGLEMNEVLALPIPERFKGFGVLKREFTRSVTHRYPVYENLIFK